MVARAAETASGLAGGRRCQCGHFPTSHMRVTPTSGTASFALEPSGPCQACGDAGCRKYTPAVP